MGMELDDITGGAVSLSPVLQSSMLVCLATKTLATSWAEEMPQGLPPTRAVWQGAEKCGIYRHRGTAPGNRGGMCRPETINILKGACLLQHSLLHSLNLPVRGAAFLPSQRWAGGSKAKLLLSAPVSSHCLRWPCTWPTLYQRLHFTSVIALCLDISKKNFYQVEEWGFVP